MELQELNVNNNNNSKNNDINTETIDEKSIKNKNINTEFTNAVITNAGDEWTLEIEDEFQRLYREATVKRFLCHQGSQRFARRSNALKVAMTVASSTLTLVSTATTTNPELARSAHVQAVQLVLSGILTVFTAIVALLAYDRNSEQLRKLGVEWGVVMTRAQYLFRFDDERRTHAKAVLEAMWDERNKMDDSDASMLIDTQFVLQEINAVNMNLNNQSDTRYVGSSPNSLLQRMSEANYYDRLVPQTGNLKRKSPRSQVEAQVEV